MSSPDNPDRLRVTWLAGKKPGAMDSWSKSIMGDQDLSRGAIRVAWALTFSFNSDDGYSWETKAKIAKRVSLSVSTVKNVLNELDSRGHIERSEKAVYGNRKMRVIWPCYTRLLAEQLPRKRKGGVAKGVNPRQIRARRGTDFQSPKGTDGQFGRGTDVQSPCIQDSSFTNPRPLADVATSSESRQLKESRFRKEEIESDNFDHVVDFGGEEDDDDDSLPELPSAYAEASRGR